MKDTKVSVVQAHRDAHAPESAGLDAGCGSGNIELRCLQKNDFSESAQLRGQVFFVHFLESCSKNFPSTIIAPPHRRGCAEAADSSARVYGSTRAERARNRFGKSNAKGRRRERRYSTCTSWFVIFQHHRQVESSPRRGAHARPPRTQIYLCWRPG